MSIFNQILTAIDDPGRAANSNQLGMILDTVQQLSQAAGRDPAMIQSALGIVGKYVQSGLKEKRDQDGQDSAEAMISRYSGVQSSEDAVLNILSTPQLRSLTAELENRTGLNFDTIEQLLPVLVPLVLQLLQSGQDSSGNRNNNVLTQFLDSDRDGDVDVIDAVQMASRYLKR